MDEETQKEKQEAKGEKPGISVEDKDVRDTTEEKPNLIEQAKLENDRKAELLKQELELQERKERLHAEEMVGGRAGLSIAERPKKLSDEEYAEALMRGEVDPLREDGFAQ